MNPQKFYSILEDLGEFHCVHDLRRIRFQKKKILTKSERHSVGATRGHHGACFNGKYHHCDFKLKKNIDRVVIYYWKQVEREGEQVRVRGGHPLNTAGRGRPPSKKSY
jgi:hypothetical protein